MTGTMVWCVVVPARDPLKPLDHRSDRCLGLVIRHRGNLASFISQLRGRRAVVRVLEFSIVDPGLVTLRLS